MSDKIQSLDSIAPIEESKIEKPKDSVQAEYEEGKQFLENRNYGQAAVALHNSLVGFEANNNETGIANASNQLGHLCLAKEEYENALNHYQRAYEICDRLYDRMSILAVLLKMVEAHRGLKEYPKAITICIDILDHYQDNRDPQGTVKTLDIMAEIYIEAGEKNKAADAYRTISSIHKNFKHESMAESYLEKAAQLED